MVCTDAGEADQVSRQLEQVDNACLVTYRRAEDLILNSPCGKVALIILATADAPLRVKHTLSWLRNRWPRCPITVIGDSGCGEAEMAAREGGAFYLARPVAPETWGAALSRALEGQEQIDMRKLPSQTGQGGYVDKF
jgi:hypothetical protein